MVLAAVPAAAQSTVDFTISGSSTVRNWTCNAQGVIAVTPASADTAAPGFPAGPQRATVTVPLKAFTCPNDEMTQHLNEAMHADKFSEVVFTMENYTVAGPPVEASGTITLTGATKTVTVPRTVTPSATGVAVAGSTRLEFATFIIEPPTVFLGMLKVGPQIRFAFKGTIARCPRWGRPPGARRAAAVSPGMGHVGPRRGECGLRHSPFSVTEPQRPSPGYAAQRQHALHRRRTVETSPFGVSLRTTQPF